MDLHAPIVPGLSAAGVSLGEDIYKLTDIAWGNRGLRRSIACDTVTVGPVRFTAVPSTGEIIQICVSEGYQGQTPHGIRLGMTLEQVAREVGEPYEDDEETLLVTGVPGLALETTAWEARNQSGFDPNGIVTHLFVFRPRTDDWV